jgi:hypothetical protein
MVVVAFNVEPDGHWDCDDVVGAIHSTLLRLGADSLMSEQKQNKSYKYPSTYSDSGFFSPPRPAAGA